MKVSIEQHRIRLADCREHLSERKKELDRFRETVIRMEADVNAYSDQIYQAEKLGVTAFDDDRFMKKRKSP